MEYKFRYNTYSDYLKNKYGEKIYKLPINIPATCPNRDGTLGYGGCIFCGEEGAGYENLSNECSVRYQIDSNSGYIRKKYKAEKFIAYFQNFSNTYVPLEKFKEYIIDSCQKDIVQISISTRPDCVKNEYLEFLKGVNKDRNVEICFELGLQTVNYHTLDKINRGHGLAEFIDAVLRIKRYGFEICVHIILDLPWDDVRDIIEAAKIISVLGIEQVKLHSLYIVKNTVLEKAYNKNEVELLSKDEYIRRAITFLEYLSPGIIIQRLIGRAPEKNTVLVNWNTSWWKIKDEIDELMDKMESFQGKKFNYMGGNILANLL
ncbi:MAG TPA: TIGR01212 family radical SAM protein [Lachnospiraceae bacterium]|nr:TIGR01212 family radical SAM protein [Lachnospiraceae bacterium]